MLFDLTDNKMTGFEMVVLTSSEYADKIIKEFKEKYFLLKELNQREGFSTDPEEILDDICNHFNIHDGDLLPNDITRVKNEVEEYLNGLY